MVGCLNGWLVQGIRQVLMVGRIRCCKYDDVKSESKGNQPLLLIYPQNHSPFAEKRASIPILDIVLGHKFLLNYEISPKLY